MAKVYLAIPGAPDKLLGHVHEAGDISRSRVGIDDHLGQVDLSSGKITSDRFGPDKKIGHIDLDSGKVYLTKVGLDEYIGRVDDDGRIYRHIPLGSDDYIGKVEPFISYAHSAGAMLLLVLPEVEEEG